MIPIRATPHGQPISTYDIRPVRHVGKQTISKNNNSCNRPLIKLIEANVSVHNNKPHTRRNGSKGEKYFINYRPNPPP